MASQASIQATPNPVEVPNWAEPGAVTLSWWCREGLDVEVHVDAADGPLLSRTGGPGTASTGKWVEDGMTFYLQDVTEGKPLHDAHTLASVTVTLSVQGKPPDARALILMYHRIADESRDPFGITVSPRHFSEHLEVLSRHPVVPLAELTAGMREGQFRDGDIVITFDDGYVDNLWNAKPALEKHGLPATVFIATAYLDDPRGYWWNEMDELVTGHGPGNPELLSTLRQILMPRPLEEKRRILALLRAWRGTSPPALTACRPMSSGELQSLAAGSLISIGAHTHTHPMLTALPPEGQLDEIRQGKHRLEEIVNRPVTHFAYPYGEQSPETPGLVASAGFESACLASGGFVWPQADLHRLPRVNVADWDGAAFQARLARWLGRVT